MFLLLPQIVAASAVVMWVPQPDPATTLLLLNSHFILPQSPDNRNPTSALR
jgi:hypothetical protein